MAITSSLRAVAVYCASSPGNDPTYRAAAYSVGHALVAEDRPLVYGGGAKGVMGFVSEAVLEAGGKVTGIVPSALLEAGGEGDKTLCNESDRAAPVVQDEARRDVQTIIVNSMHERKVEMAKRSCAFVGLPGGFGTFEEVLEAITWTQIGIHDKPVILVNVFGFWEPLRALIKTSIASGFIRKDCDSLVIFVDGPEDHAAHASYDWGMEVMKHIDNWKGAPKSFYKWT
ncbi:hypothetical protein PENSPDRAFT_582937 [Peniophora sp. CONT]|nr:hypothetical protein PENSPDRAFT_582937 [Peniophora sp. CONT]